MGQGQGRSRCALWGGISLGVGTLAYALFSPSSAGCSTNVVVLTHSAVTERGCAAYSVMSHTGVGLMVLGAVLLLGSFALALRSRRLAATSPVVASDMSVAAARETVVPATGQSTRTLVAPVASAVVDEHPETSAIPEPEPAPPPTRPAAPEPELEARRGPIAPGEDFYEPADSGQLGPAVLLPPGWYGNPDVPGKSVQWWDGTKLTEGPQ